MAPRLVKRPRNAVAVRLGPLVMTLAVRESWRSLPEAAGLGEWEVTPRGSWAYGVVDPQRELPFWQTVRRRVGAVPFDAATAAVRIPVRAAPLPEWSAAGAEAGPPPISPVHAANIVETRDLLPYGCARLRITEMPTVELSSRSPAPFPEAS